MQKQWMAAVAACALLAGAAQAQSQVAAAQASAEAADHQRAVVLADQELWHQAGMSFLPRPVSYSYVQDTPEYRRYEQLRNGPAFREAVAKHLGAARTTAQQGSPATLQ